MTDEEYLFKQAQIAKKKLAAAFDLWKNAQITMCEELPEEPEAVAAEPEEIEEAPSAPDILREAEKIPLVKLPSFDPANIAALIAALAGSGAKLTIEVTL